MTTDPPSANYQEEPIGRTVGNRELTAMRDQVRTLYRLVVALSIGLVVCFTIAVQAKYRKTVSLRQLNLIAQDGSNAAKLHFDNGYPKLSFFDSEGKLRGIFDAAGLILYGDDGRTMLREIGDGSRLEFRRNYDGIETQTWIANDGQRQQIVLKSKHRQEEVRMALDMKSGARLQIVDDSGSLVLPEQDD